MQDHFAKKSTHLNLSNLNKTLLNYYSPGPSFQYIFDIPSRTLDWVSQNVENILPVNSETFTIEDYVDLIHEDDMDYFARCEKNSGFFLFNHIDKSEIPFYKVCYQLRMNDHSESHKLFLRQSIAIKLDEDHGLSKVLCNTSDISHITQTNNGKVSYIDVRGKKSFIGISSIKDFERTSKLKVICSQRELEILRLLAEGFRSKEIADCLHISYDTVRTHRTNILKKTKMRSLTQVVSTYIRDGVL